jgi:hypothetical protein
MAQVRCPLCNARTSTRATNGETLTCTSCGGRFTLADLQGASRAPIQAGAAVPPPPRKRRSGAPRAEPLPPPVIAPPLPPPPAPGLSDGGLGTLESPLAPGEPVRMPISSADPPRGAGPVSDGAVRSAALSPIAVAASATRPRRRVHWYWRLLAWIVAVPLGLAIVGLPARRLGYVTSDKLADVLLEHDLGRFVPLLIVVALWALVTAVLVHLFVEGGSWLSRHRKRRGDPPSAYASDPGAPPPPPRHATGGDQRRRTARRTGS